MRVSIIDGPPSTGATLRVNNERIHAGRSSFHRPEFVRECLPSRTITSSDALSRAIQLSITAFIDTLGDAEMSGYEEVVFDGSPISIRALGTLVGIKPDDATLSVLREFSTRYREIVQVNLLMPVSDYIAPPLMRVFPREKIIPFSQLLLDAYTTRHFTPHITRVERSPYIDIDKGRARLKKG